MVSQTFSVLQDLLSSPSSSLIILLIVLLVLAALWSMHLPVHLPPGPRGLPFFGSMFDMATDHATKLSALTKEYGDIFSIKIGRHRIVVLNDIECVREALVKKQNDFAGRPWSFSLSLLSEDGEGIKFGKFTPKWKALRKIGHQAIRNYASGYKLERVLTVEIFPRFKVVISEKKGKPFDPKPLLSLLVINVVASICFGYNYDFSDPRFQDFMTLLNKTDESFGNGLLADYIPIFQYIPTKGLRDLKRLWGAWLALIQSEINEHKGKGEKGEVHDLLDDVLKIQREEKATGADAADMLTDVNIRQLVSDIFAAGMDTTSLTLTWIIAYLISYPDVQAKVQEEIDDVIGRDRSPLLSDRGHLPYCVAAIHEVMRIRTLLTTSLPHETTTDTSVGGFNIPKGTQIWINTWHLHMSEKNWTNPEEFRPERFLDGNGKALPKPESFLPFSTGRRVCLGEVLAKNELFLIFVSLFQQFTFLPAPGTEKPNLSPYFEGFLTKCRPYEVIARARIAKEK